MIDLLNRWFGYVMDVLAVGTVVAVAVIEYRLWHDRWRHRQIGRKLD